MFKNWIYLLFAVSLVGCSMGKSASSGSQESSFSSGSGGDPGSAGGGSKVPGVGALSVPTGEAIVERMKVGLENQVTPVGNGTNFARAFTLLKGNLPQVTDPLKATGFDQVQLLVYAACSDLTNGNTPRMQSTYSVSKSGTIATNQTALVNAGIRMLDKYVADLASQGPTSAEVKKAFQDIVTKVNVDGNNSTIAFMSVCIAANTAGSSLIGF